jgi:membrane protease YdiL (CAAX protease family)
MANGAAGAEVKALAHYIAFPLRISAFPKKSTLILLSAPILLTLHRYYGSMEFYERSLANFFPTMSAGLAAPLFMFFSAFFLLGIIPILLIKFVFKERLSDYGIQMGDVRWGLLALVGLLPVIVLLLIPSARMESFRAVYPFYRNAGDSLPQFLFYEILRGVFFYTAWEFFFRGFMFQGLRESLGDWNALVVQIIPSCLWHIGFPDGEIFGSIIGGFLFAFLVLRTKSLLSAFLLHWGMGIILDALIILKI